MLVNKKIAIAAIASGVIGAGAIGATSLAASANSYPPMVQKIADTFHLDPSKVNNVFKQERQSHDQDRQAMLKTRLNQAVKDGKLTSDQETKLLAELKSLHEKYKAEEKSDRQNLKSDLEQWAKDNGIANLEQILPSPPAGNHRHMM